VLPTCAFTDANAATTRHDVIGDEKGPPASLTGLFGTTYRLYVHRIGLYVSLALAAFAVQCIVDLAVMRDDGLAIGLNIIVGSFVTAAVSIGVAFDLAQKDADWSTIFNAASLRWGVVVIVNAVYYVAYRLFWPSVFAPPEETGYGILLIPFILLLGAIALATVVAAIDPAKSRLTLPLVALAKGFIVSAQFVNLGRLMMFSVLLMLPMIAETFLEVYLLRRGVPAAGFWAAVPIDALVMGPLQAFATVLYVDFLRRAHR
jgi:hypothetical protein